VLQQVSFKQLQVSYNSNNTGITLTAVPVNGNPDLNSYSHAVTYNGAAMVFTSSPFYLGLNMVTDIPCLNIKGLAATLEYSGAEAVMLVGPLERHIIVPLQHCKHCSVSQLTDVSVLQVNGVVTPVQHISITGLALRLSKSGLHATTNGSVVGIPVSATINVTKPATGTGAALSLSASTLAPANLGKAVATLWPNAPAAALTLLEKVTFSSVQVTFNSTVKRVAIKAFPGAAGFPDLAELVKDAGDAFTFKAPVFEFAASADMAGSIPSFTVTMLVDFPTMAMVNRPATLSVANGKASLLVSWLGMHAGGCAVRVVLHNFGLDSLFCRDSRLAVACSWRAP
jgi:hypothetical protein